MDAAADYARAANALRNAHLPAYVTYTVHASAGFDTFRHCESTTLVVRTRDGKIVKGALPAIKISADAAYADDVIRHPPFEPACYTPQSAAASTFDARPVEAIVIVSQCGDTRGDSSRSSDFRTLYLDAATHRPLAVVGGSTERGITAQLVERFARWDGYLLPAEFRVKISGSGAMFWLNVDADQIYTDYRFSATEP